MAACYGVRRKSERVRSRLIVGGNATPLPLAATIAMLLGSSRLVAPLLNRVAHRVLLVMTVAALASMLLVAFLSNHRRWSMAGITGTVVLVMATWIGVVPILSIITVVMRPVITVAGVLMHGTAAQQEHPEKQHEKT
ncbi:hypothetical protein [Stutzerimonas chloritidismutans]